MKHNHDIDLLNSRLDSLRLPFLKEQCQPVAATAAKNSITHLAYLQQLIEGESALRDDRAVARRIQAARFPVIKTLDSFRWDWPKKINRLQVQDLFRLQFVHDKANVIFLGLVGLGKSHLATALGYAACQQGIHGRILHPASHRANIFSYYSSVARSCYSSVARSWARSWWLGPLARSFG